MQASYAKRIEAQIERFMATRRRFATLNPYGVPISTGGWAGNGLLSGSALLTTASQGVSPIWWTRISHSGLLSMYTGVTLGRLSLLFQASERFKESRLRQQSSRFHVYRGGVVPGVLVLKPDFPENKEDWPFLWERTSMLSAWELTMFISFTRPMI